MKHKLFLLLLNLLPKKIAHQLLYKRKMGKKLNLKDPKDLNEKLQYLMIYKYGKKEGFLSDKYRVKEYINNYNIEDLYIPKTLKVYNSVNEIKLDDLPEKFVLKCNHGSGKAYICKSKENFDLDKVKRELKQIFNKSFSKDSLEYHYSYIKPVIMIEEYLDDGINTNPIDYKFYCHNGVVESILVCSERDKGLKLDDFDLNWNHLDYTLDKYRSSKVLEKPNNLEKMIEIASKLSKDLPFVRVDLYSINNKIYFGELTFTPAAGVIYYYKQFALDKLGSIIDLNDYK